MKLDNGQHAANLHQLFLKSACKKDLYFGNTGFIDSAGAGPGIGLVVGSIGFECQRNVGDAGNDDSDSLPAF